ncbi:hypothetical protein MPDQ_006472 [Monascus purpureus]|uniref:Rhodopsin domain-containing protein n=1 Tax=Monascus purpureus TaxID=5098 RepID=A0A507QYP8_MONPU|nr:hypothetical protein MPDQ_006472 [Monascus purpureus]
MSYYRSRNSLHAVVIGPRIRSTDGSCDRLVYKAVYSAQAIYFIIGVVRHGISQSADELPKQTYSDGMRVIFACLLLYYTGTYMMKLSFIFTLHRIVQNKKYYRYTLYLLIFTGLVITLVIMFWVLFFCRPVSYFWRQVADPDGGSCRAINKMTIASVVHACWILVADIMLGLVLPVLLLRQLQMNIRTKSSVLLLLGLSLLATIATIIRISYVTTLTTADMLRSNNPIILWSTMELATNIITTSATTWKPLLVKLGIITSSEISAPLAALTNSRKLRNQNAFSIELGRSGKGPQTLVEARPAFSEGEVETSSTERILVEREVHVYSDYHGHQRGDY